MATPPVKAKHDCTPPSESTNAKQKPLELTSTNTTNPPDTPSPPFINSVSELRSLSTTLSAFLRRYDDLQGHLDYIRTNIGAKLPITASELANSEENPNAEKPAQSELERICQGRCGRNLRIYFLSHLSEINKLREEAPKALKRARDPARLVLNCFGRFYFQGIKAYTKDSPSPMITSREASIFGLECFLLMGCDGVVIEPAVKEEAELAALAWRNRLMAEGGLTKACEADARGLLLLISCFGIPRVFCSGDVRDLLRSCNLREIAGALLRSSVLKARIPEVLDGMVKNKLEIDAVDIAYTLEVENFPQKTLTVFLYESEETWKSTRKEAKGSSAAMNKANKKQFANLKSVITCLEKHKFDPSKLLPEWKINEKILSLEKEISDLHKKNEEKAEWKRTADETKSSNKEVKRPRVADYVQQQPRPAAFTDGKSSNNMLTQVNVMEGGFPGLINGYSASPALPHGSGAGSLLDNITSLIAGNLGGLLAAGVGAGNGVVQPTAMYGGVNGGMVVDTAAQMTNDYCQFYGRREDAALNDTVFGHTFPGHPSSVGYNAAYRSSPSMQGFSGLPSQPPSMRGFAGLPSQPPSMEGLAGLPSHRPSMEGFAGFRSHQSVGGSGRSSESNLYHFTEVLESELNKGSGSRTGGTVHKSSVRPAVSAHHSSYLY